MGSWEFSNIGFSCKKQDIKLVKIFLKYLGVEFDNVHGSEAGIINPKFNNYDDMGRYSSKYETEVIYTIINKLFDKVCIYYEREEGNNTSDYYDRYEEVYDAETNMIYIGEKNYCYGDNTVFNQSIFEGIKDKCEEKAKNKNIPIKWREEFDGIYPEGQKFINLCNKVIDSCGGIEELGTDIDYREIDSVDISESIIYEIIDEAAKYGDEDIIERLKEAFFNDYEPNRPKKIEERLPIVQKTIKNNINRINRNQEDLIAEHIIRTNESYENINSLDKDFTVGNTIRFGYYRQGMFGEDFPLEWVVLERKGNGAKLLSVKGIEILPFNNIDEKTNWSDCTLRSWLNEEFYNYAFSDAEAKSVILMDVIAAKHPKYSTNQGKNTKDKVFILDYQEADSLKSLKRADSFMSFKYAFLSEWAYDKCDYFKSSNLDIKNWALYWLRNMASSSKRALVMGEYTSGKNVTDVYAIRPVIWVNLNSDFFGGSFEELVTDAKPDITVDDIISLLEEKYTIEEKPLTVAEFDKQNSEFRQQLNELKKNCVQKYGMTYGEFLIRRGFLKSKEEKLREYDPSEMISVLRNKYINELTKPQTISELIKDNPEYEEDIIQLDKLSKKKFGETSIQYLKRQGIIFSSEDNNILKQKLKEEQREKKNAEKLAARDIERKKVVDKIEITDSVLAENVENMFAKIDLYYPEHKVFALDSLDKNLGEKLSNYSKKIGYKSTDDMLKAYGYEKIIGTEVSEIRPCVICNPGNEPDVIKKKVESVLERLEEYYPSKVIEESIQNNHKSLSNSISGIYQWLGYESVGEFLSAYGYKYKASEAGRPTTTNANDVIDELRKRSLGKPYSGIKELVESNPDLSGKIKTIRNKSNDLFGMSLMKYLMQEGIIK